MKTGSFKKEGLCVVVFWVAIFAVVAFGDFKPEVGEHVVSMKGNQGRLLFLVEYQEQIEATTAPIAVKWASVKHVTRLLATETDMRKVFQAMTDEEKSVARLALIELKKQWFQEQKDAIARQEDEVTSGL